MRQPAYLPTKKAPSQIGVWWFSTPAKPNARLRCLSWQAATMRWGIAAWSPRRAGEPSLCPRGRLPGWWRMHRAASAYLNNVSYGYTVLFPAHPSIPSPLSGEGKLTEGQRDEVKLNDEKV